MDTDALIVEREGRSTSEMFAAEGEGYFRDLELSVSRELGEKEGLIIAAAAACHAPRLYHSPEAKRCGVLAAPGPSETYDTMDTAGRPWPSRGREDSWRALPSGSPFTGTGPTM